MGIEEKRAAREKKLAAHKDMLAALNLAAEEALYDAEDVYGIGCAQIVRDKNPENPIMCVAVLSDAAKVGSRILRDKMASEKIGHVAKREEQDTLARKGVFWPTKERPCSVPGAPADYDALIERAPLLPLSICNAIMSMAGVLDREEGGK